jgi:DNA (cytosine-5)-methyltransferase 1
MVKRSSRKQDSWAPGTPIERNAHFWTGEPQLLMGHAAPRADRLSVVDLFSGCGGFSEGFRQAGFEPLLAVDIHPQSIQTIQANHGATSTILGDIRKVSAGSVRDLLRGIEVDVLTAGVPCQGFSLCNRKRHDKDDRNFLFLEFVRLVKALKPRAVLLENVGGIRTAGGGSFSRAICDSIEDLGFRVSCRTLNAADFGVPQRRQRVFFLGLRDCEPEEWWPTPTHGSAAPNPWVSVSEAIGDLPTLESGESSSRYCVSPRSVYQQMMRGAQIELLNHEAPSHAPDVVRKIESTQPGEPIYAKFKQRIRLDPNCPSPTQVSGGIRPQYQFGHPTQARGLTIRERCRIQSFPDSYLIQGGIVQGRVQTGNAVPPLLARAIASRIHDQLLGRAAHGKRRASRQLVFNLRNADTG